MRKFSFKNVAKWFGILLVAFLLVEIVTQGKASLTISYFMSSISGTNHVESGEGFEKATVAYAVDGDTIVVNTAKGEKKVRMIGVNTPESVHADESLNTDEGSAASSYTKSQLKTGTIVYLQYDKDLEDQYGRTLAYVWLTDDCNPSSYEDFCKYNYGAILLQNTYCEAVYYAPNGIYRAWYEKLDKQFNY